MPEAEELHELARSVVSSGAFSRAHRLLDRAARSADTPDLIARIDLTRAYIEAETGDPSTGISECVALLERAGLEAETRGLVWSQLGLLRMRTGAADQALESFAHAIELLPHNGEYVGRVLLNRGNVHLQRGHVRQAVGDFTAALEHLTGDGL